MESTDAPSPAKRSKAGKVTKKRMPKSSLQLVNEVVDEGVLEKEPANDDEEANLQRALELSLKEQRERTQGPASLVVIREPDSGRIQPLPETPKPKNLTDQFIFQRRTPMPIEPSKHADSPSLDADFSLTNSETESEKEVLVIKAGDQDEGQAGPNPGEQDEGQAGSNPDDAAESQPQPSHVENLKLLTEDQVILEEPASSTGTLSSLQNLDNDLSFTDQFFVEKPYKEEPGKTNAEAEVQSMVSVPIHQDTSSVPPLTTLVIDLMKSQSDSPLPTSTTTTSTITTTTTLPPPPLQSTTDLILVHCIGELEQHIANLIQNNLALEESSQRMFEDNTYKTYEVHNDLYEALQKSVELDNSNQHLADQEEARKKNRKRRESPRTPPGSPPTPPPLLPPLAGASSAPDLHSNKAVKLQDDSIPEEHVHLFDDEDFENDHQPKANLRKDWWKPLPEEERPATPEPAWTIPSSNKSDVVNNWASVLATTYEPPAENSLLVKIGDMTTFMNWYCQKMSFTFSSRWRSVTRCSQIRLTGRIQKELKIGVLEIWQQGKQSRTIDFEDKVQHMASFTGGLIDRSSILTDITLHRIVKKSEHTCRFSVSLGSKPTQDTGHLDHLPGSNKQMLSIAVKLWTRNLVIRQRAEDFQLDIESYQT
ncbi:copia protein [Tanacetum coccineum]